MAQIGAPLEARAHTKAQEGIELRFEWCDLKAMENYSKLVYIPTMLGLAT
jgi:hypothetical protein